MYKSGFVSIIGSPNAGKSSFLNAVLGHKVSIVTNKVQTTRNVIRGIYHEDELQIVFLDTPGIHVPKDELQKFMSKEVKNSLNNVDAILYIIDGSVGLRNKEKEIIERLKKEKAPIIAAVNKIDLVSQEKVQKIIKELLDYEIFEEIIPMTVLKKFNEFRIIDLLKNHLGESVPFYEKDQITDSPESFMISEIIREKIIKFTGQEIPHNVSVVVTDIERKSQSINISSTIYVTRESQKGIIIGKKGSLLQKIGTTARKDIQEMYNKKVNLFNTVKVIKNWHKDENLLSELGYTDKKE